MSKTLVSSLRIILILILCGAARANAETPPRVMIEINNFMFEPKAVTVAPGTEVVWVNHDADPHTVVSSDDHKVFTSPVLDTGDKFSFVFKSAGTFAYYCSVHPHMQGAVIVK